jgi:3-deoxy-D-manno-octulosonic-acid transferase
MPRKNTSVYLFDTIGEMGLAYRLSSVAFVCGSLKEGLTGHNPLEPAQLRMAVLSGPHIKSFADIYTQMIEFGDAVRIVPPDMIAKTILGLWADDDALAKAGDQALAFAERRGGILDKVWGQLTPILPRASS